MTVTDITVVTGPTRGLGRALVDELRRREGQRLVLAGRGPAVPELARRVGAEVLAVDLADLTTVDRAGRELAGRVTAGELPPVRTLVLNAGVQVADRLHRSTQGHELTFAVNVLAQHVLLRALQPALAVDAHVVLLGSGTHWGGRRSFWLVAPPRWEDPRALALPGQGAGAARPVAGQRAYATSKLAVLLLARAWQHRTSARVNVYDPGLMPGTGLARELAPWQQWAWRRVLPAMRVLPGVTSPHASARHLAAFALGAVAPNLRGGCMALGHEVRTSPASYDTERGERLWQVCQELADAAVPA